MRSQLAGYITALFGKAADHDVAPGKPAEFSNPASILAVGKFSPIEPKQVGLWSGPWEGPVGEGTVGARLRRCQGGWSGLDGIGISSRLRASRSTEREVVMVLGAALDRDQLFDQVRKAKPPTPAIHCIHLLRSMMAGVASVSARLTVLCG
jgi:hypothetical protein